MKNNSSFAELLYVVSNFEKGRIKTNSIWTRKYVKSLKKSLEIMEIITNLLSENRRISREETSILQSFIHDNSGVMFSCHENIDILLSDNETDFLHKDLVDVIELMNEIIMDIKNLLCMRSRNYKLKISFLLRAFHNLPRVFFGMNDIKALNLHVSPLSKQDAIESALSYISQIDKFTI